MHDENAWYIRDNLALKKGGNSNVRKFLAAVLGEDFLCIHTLHRLKLYAMDRKGNYGQDYFELLT
jgi:hypothetical protein